MDWTKIYNQKKINDFCNDFVKDLIEDISKIIIKHNKKLNFKSSEIFLIYRWSIYVAVNTFTERLLRSLNTEYLDLNSSVIKNKIDYLPYKNILDATLNFYNNKNLNNVCLENLQYIINNQNINVKDLNLLNNFLANTIEKKESNLNQYKLRFNFYLKNIFFNYFYYKSYKPSLLYENTYQLRLIFEKNQTFLNYPSYNYKIANNLRKMIRQTSIKIFLKKYAFLLKKLKPNQKECISILFSYWIDKSIPLSLIEGLNERFSFYENLLNSLTINSFHAQTGYFFNENIKIFSVIAKRKKIKIIGHEHGLNNFVKNGKHTSSVGHYKGDDHLLFSDIFFGWGKSDLSDKWYNAKKSYNTDVHEIGSVYLGSIKKNKKFKKNKKDFLIFYCPSQFKTFMSNVEESSTEDNYKHKENFANFLKKILSSNKKIRVFYKKFQETSTIIDDPIYLFLSKEIKQKKILIINNNTATDIMNLVDLVLFDSISTGFAENINVGTPSIIFSNKYEFSISSNDGKKINKKLNKDGIIVYNEKDAIKSFNSLYKNKRFFLKKSEKNIVKFMEALAYPISKERFLKKINSVIKKY